MAQTHEGPMKIVQARGVFELSGLNYVQIWVKGQEKWSKNIHRVWAIAVWATKISM